MEHLLVLYKWTKDEILVRPLKMIKRNQSYKNDSMCLHTLRKRLQAIAQHNGQRGVKRGARVLRGRKHQVAVGGTS